MQKDRERERGESESVANLSIPLSLSVSHSLLQQHEIKIFLHILQTRMRMAKKNRQKIEFHCKKK